MSALPPIVADPRERARKMAGAILQAVQRDGRQAAIAAAMGASESTVSRLMSDHLDKLCLVLAHAGLKTVPCEAQCFAPDKVAALLTLARDHLATIERTEQLVWE